LLTFILVLQFLRDLRCLPDVPALSALVATAEQDNKGLPATGEVDTVSGPWSIRSSDTDPPTDFDLRTAYTYNWQIGVRFLPLYRRPFKQLFFGWMVATTPLTISYASPNSVMLKISVGRLAYFVLVGLQLEAMFQAMFKAKHHAS
jgi:hypothetical protein